MALLNALPGDRPLLTAENLMNDLRLEFNNEDFDGVDRWELHKDITMFAVERLAIEYYHSFPSSIKRFLFRAKPNMPTDEEVEKRHPGFFGPQEYDGKITPGFDSEDALSFFYIPDLEKFFFTVFDERVKTLKSLGVAFRALEGIHRGGGSNGAPTLGAGVNLSVMPSVLRISESGFLQFGGSDISAAISRGEIDGRRIRTCPICGHFFWATRLNRKACSDQHAATLRQQNYRNRDKEKENARKRDNRRYLKKLRVR